MDNEVVRKIIDNTGQKDLLNILTKEISFSELNSLLLEIYKIRAGEITPAELLNRYASNRFVKPCEVSPIELMQLELEILKIAKSFSFTAVELSPLAVLGTCSVIAKADQNKVVSALRGTEVMADATNALALYICNLKRGMKGKEPEKNNDRMRVCTTQRVVRAQKYSNPNFLPHFKLFCMVTSGEDSGSYTFEKESILEHLNVYTVILKNINNLDSIKISFSEMDGYADSNGFITRLIQYLHENVNGELSILRNHSKFESKYYKGLQFKIYVNINGTDFEIADGGFVDWSQKLLQRKKERMLISGLGIEWLKKLI